MKKYFSTSLDYVKENIVLTRNIVYILLGNVIVLLVSLPYLSTLAKSLGTTGFGFFSVVLAYSSIIAMVIDLGAGKIITREIIENNYEKSLSLASILAPKGIILLFTVGILALIQPFPGGIEIIILSALIGFFMNLSITARSVFNAYERNEFNVIGLVTERIVTFSFAWMGLKSGTGILGVFLAVCLGNFMDTLISWWLVKKYYWQTFKYLPFNEVKKHLIKYLRLGFPILIVAVASTVYYRSPVILLEKYAGLQLAGWFNAAFQLLLISWYLPQAVGYVIFPFLTKNNRNQNGRDRSGNLKMLFVMFAFGVVIALILFLTSEWIVTTIYGNSFKPAVDLLKILSISIPFTYAATIAIQDVISKGYQNRYAVLFGVVSSLGIILFVLLLPLFGVFSASIIFLSMEVLNCFLFFVTFLALNKTGKVIV